MNKGKVIAALSIIAAVIVLGFLLFRSSPEQDLVESADHTPAEPLQEREDTRDGQSESIPPLPLIDGAEKRVTTAQISGHTYLLPGNEALEGAHVTLAGQEKHAFSSRSDGSFAFTDLPPGTYLLQATTPLALSLVPRDHGRPLHITVDGGEHYDDIVIGFEEGVTLQGQVYDAVTNEGIPNSAVTLECYYAQSDLEELISRVVTTDADGNFSVSGFPSVAILEIRASAEFYTLGATRTYEGLLERVSPVKLPLNPGAGGIEGIVRDAAGVPVADFSFAAQSNERSPRRATTTVEGQFLIENLDAGLWSLYYSQKAQGRSPGIQTNLAEVEVFAAQISEVELRVELYTGTVNGKVIDETGAPMSGVSISQGWDLPVDLVTGNSGAFNVSILNAKQDFVRLVARHPEYGETISGPITLGENDAEIAFERGGMLNGRVIAKQDGTPIHSFVVQATGLDDDGNLDWNSTTLQRAFRSENGAFQLGPLEPGQYGVVAWADGFGKSLPLTAAVVAGGSPAFLDIALLPEKTLLGTVVNATGDPVESVYVSVGEGSENLTDALAVSDKDGKFVLGNLTAGALSIRLYNAEYVTLHTQVHIGNAADTEHRFMMAMGAEIFGVVYQDRIPKALASVIVVAADGTLRLEITDDSGSYRFGNLATGDYSLTWRDENQKEQSKDIQLNAGFSFEEDIHLAGVAEVEVAAE